MGVARVYAGVADTRSLSICLLRRARRNLHFDPPKLGGRPPTGELIAPLYHSLILLQSPSLRTQLWPTGRRSIPSSIIVLWTALYQAGGRTALYRPLCLVLYSKEGMALYRPLCSVLYIRGGGTALYRPLCSVLCITRGGQLSTVPCAWFYILFERSEFLIATRYIQKKKCVRVFD